MKKQSTKNSQQASTTISTQPASRKAAYITDAIIIAIASAWVYAIAFSFEAGFASEFDIPYQLITLDTATVLISAGAIIPIWFIAGAILEFTWFFSPRHNTPVWKELRSIILAFGIWSAFIFMTSLDWYVLLFLVLLIVFYDLPRLAKIVFGRKWTGSFSERLGKLQKHEEEEELMLSKVETERSLIAKLINRQNAPLLFIASILVFSVLLAHLTGGGYARRYKEYFVLADTPNVAVIRIYGTNLITAEYDSASKEIIGPITINQLANNQVIKLNRVLIGPLTMRKQTTSNSK